MFWYLWWLSKILFLGIMWINYTNILWRFFFLYFIISLLMFEIFLDLIFSHNGLFFTLKTLFFFFFFFYKLLRLDLHMFIMKWLFVCWFFWGNIFQLIRFLNLFSYFLYWRLLLRERLDTWFYLNTNIFTFLRLLIFSCIWFFGLT